MTTYSLARRRSRHVGFGIAGLLLGLACSPPAADNPRLFSIAEDDSSVTLTILVPVAAARWSLDAVENVAARDQTTYSVVKADLAGGDHVIEVVVSLDLIGDGDLEEVSDRYHFTVGTSTDLSVFETRVASNSDDAEERPTGQVNRSSTDLEMTEDLARSPGDQQQVVGLRFIDVSVPRGAVIDQAHLEFAVDETSASSSSLRIAVEDSGSATAITTQRFGLSTRATAGEVAWVPDSWNRRGEVKATPDLSSLVQAVVDREDWAAGNALLFTIYGTGTRTAVSHDGDQFAAPRLVVHYRDGSGPDNPSDTDPPPGTDVTPGDVALPARAAFYYPWFPETWTVNGSHVFYEPVLDYYSSDDPSVVDAHIEMMDYAKIDVAIFSWWGPNTHKEQTRIPLLMDRTEALGSDIRWAAYYEKEGSGNPPTEQLSADLTYLRQAIASRPGYATVAGKPVLFVYNAGDSSCALIDRWGPFLEDWYVVLKVFTGYSACPQQPDAWHQYAPAKAVDHQAGHSYAISPGFWRADEAEPRLKRNISHWRDNVRAMVASGEPWQLVTTFNEWGEGTAVEHAFDWTTSGHGLYLDALHNDGVATTSPETVSFGAAGDFGGRDDRAGTVMTDMVARNLAAFFLLGDMSYSEITPEQDWCDWVHGYLGDSYPLQVIAGNHEEDSKVDGWILNFAECMPDRLASELGPGGYSVNFASDLGPVTFVATSPDLQVDGVDYKYAPGSPERSWLVTAIRNASAEGDWVVVGMHKNCLTIGNKSCEIGADFAQLLVDEGVDLVLQGHDHDYQRSHSLLTIVEDGVGTVADMGLDSLYARDSGTVFVIVGTAGRSMTTCSHDDSEYGNFAAHWCGEEATDTKGYLVVTAGPGRLEAEFVTTAGTAFSDLFAIE